MTRGTGRSSSRSASKLTARQGRRRQGRPVGLLHRDDATWRTTGRRWSGRTAATSSRADWQADPPRQRPGHRRHPVPPGPDLQGQDHARSGVFADDRRRVRAGQGRHGGERLVARGHPPRRRASTSASRRCPRARPARPPRSTRPAPSSLKGTKNPDAAWEFVKYLASPAAQTKMMELKASLPANKEVLAGPYARSFDGAKVLADAIAYAHLKPSFKGYNDGRRRSRPSSTRTSSTTPNKTAQQAIDDVLPQLDDDPRRASDGTRPTGRDRPMTAVRRPAVHARRRSARPASAAGRCCSSPRR